MRSSECRDLIIGLGDLEFEQIEPFIASLSNVSFTGVVCILASNLALATRLRLRSAGVTVVDFKRFVRPDRHMMNSRFFASLDFIARNRDRFDRVMLTDVRDVVFQADPFDALGSAEVVYACERAPIKACPINGAWVYQAYGYGVLENVRDYRIACAGTTIGTTNGILQYLGLMVDEMSTCEILRTNIDQGIHNFVVRMRPFRGAYFDEHDETVATLDHLPEPCIDIREGRILIDGRVQPVVHQWDRRANVATLVSAQPEFRWPTSGTRAGFRQSPLEHESLHPTRDTLARCRPEHEGEEDVLLVYFAQGDSANLPRWLETLHATGYLGRVILCHRVGIEPDLRILPANCEVFRCGVGAELGDANAAHLCLGRALIDVRAKYVIAIASCRCSFQYNPFDCLSPRLSLASEGAKLIGDCQINQHWIRQFQPLDEALLVRQIVTSEIVGGAAPFVRAFYDRLTQAFDSAEPARVQDKSIQGLFQILAADRALSATVHPNGSWTYTDFWPSEMIVSRERTLRVGGGTPAVLFETARHQT